MAEETPGKKYNKKDFIQALSKIEVVLEDKDEDERARRRMEQACTEDEGALASLIDELFDNASRNANDGPRSTPIDLDVSQTGKDIANIGASNDEHDKIDDIAPDGIDDNSINDDDAVECIVGLTKRKINCRLAKVNELCLKIISLKGREMMEKANTKVMRFRKTKQNQRMNEFYKALHLEYVNAYSNECVTNAFSCLNNKLI